MTDAQTLELQPKGSLDVDSSSRLRRELAAALTVGVRAVTVDLSQVTAVDPTGLNVLAGAARHLSKTGGSLVVIRPSKPAARGLRINGLEHLVASVPATPKLTVLPGSGSGGPPNRPRRLAVVTDEAG